MKMQTDAKFNFWKPTTHPIIFKVMLQLNEILLNTTAHESL